MRSPSSFNTKYAYVLNNPINFSDPMGTFGLFGGYSGAILAGAILGATDPFGIVSGSLDFVKRNKYQIAGAALAVTGT